MLVRAVGIEEVGRPTLGKPDHEELMKEGRNLIARARREWNIEKDQLEGKRGSSSAGERMSVLDSMKSAFRKNQEIEMPNISAPVGSAKYAPSRFQRLDDFSTSSGSDGGSGDAGPGGGPLAPGSGFLPSFLLRPLSKLPAGNSTDELELSSSAAKDLDQSSLPEWARFDKNALSVKPVPGKLVQVSERSGTAPAGKPGHTPAAPIAPGGLAPPAPVPAGPNLAALLRGTHVRVGKSNSAG
jgi:hypothetical protein